MALTTDAPRPHEEVFSTADLNRWLADLQRVIVERLEQPAYVHPTVITFNDSKQKNEWMGYQNDVGERNWFQEIEKASTKGKGGFRIGIVDSWNETYVGKSVPDDAKRMPLDRAARKKQNQWDLVGWHMWAFAITKSKGGKRLLLIMDCDEDVRRDSLKTVADLTTQRGRQLVRDARRNWSSLKPDEVWVGNMGSAYSGRDQCVNATTLWVDLVASREATPVDTEKIGEDERFKRFKKIGLQGS